jgi:hypothetical protein
MNRSTDDERNATAMALDAMRPDLAQVLDAMAQRVALSMRRGQHRFPYGSVFRETTMMDMPGGGGVAYLDLRVEMSDADLAREEFVRMLGEEDGDEPSRG